MSFNQHPHSRKKHCSYALLRALIESEVILFHAGASMHNFHALEAQVFHCLVWCPQHAGQSHLVGHESHLASQAALLLLAASCPACFSFSERTLHCTSVEVSEMIEPPNHPKFDHFSLETCGFGDLPFSETSTCKTKVFRYAIGSPHAKGRSGREVEGWCLLRFRNRFNHNCTQGFFAGIQKLGEK